MKVRILFVRSLPLGRDARSTKMVAEYRKRGHHVVALIWSRGESAATDADTITCTARGGYGQRLRGLAARLKWMWFLAARMIKHRHDYDVVHVVDLDTGIVGVPIARLLRKPVVYDAFDHIVAIVGGGPVGTLLAHVERWTIDQAAIGVFPDPIRLEQYDIQSDGRVEIIGNIPDLRGIAVGNAVRSGYGPLRLVYIGTLEAVHRGLEYLPAVCAHCGDAVEVVVGGTGELHGYFTEAAMQFSNLVYIGHQEYDEALHRMAEADCLYGPYLLSAPAHRYASPNKMYEHLALGVPLITAVGTPPAELVARLDSGFLFDGTLDGLRALLACLDRETCRTVGLRAATAWEAEFAGMRKAQLDRFFARLDCIMATARAV